MPISIERAPTLPLQPQSPPGQIEAQTIADCYDWLSFHRLWGELKAETLDFLARSLQLLKVESGTEIYQDGQAPAGLYLLKWGSVEIYRLSQVGKTHMLYRSAGEMFGYVPLIEGQRETCYRASAIAISPSEIWFLDQADFQQLITDHPDIQSIFNRLLAQDLVNFAQRIAKEQARIQGLQSYICPVPTQETLIGRSKASTKLAQQVKADR